MLYFGWYANARNKSGKSNANDEMRKQLVDEVCWAGDDYGNPNLKELKTPFVISPKLYDAFVTDRAESPGRATSTTTYLDLMSAAPGFFVDYLFGEEDALKNTFETTR